MTNYIDKSERITKGVRKSFQSVECKVINRRCYGYDTMPDAELIINETEAKSSVGFSRGILPGSVWERLQPDCRSRVSSLLPANPNRTVMPSPSFSRTKKSIQ